MAGRPDKFPDPWLARTIHALAVDQHTVPEIVEQTGATRDVVRGYLHRAGLKVPDGRTANGYRRQAASPCGTLTAYSCGCRCPECKRAMREYQQDRRDDDALE